jgi:hypothetical protein
VKKIYFILISFIFLTGCVQSVALVGPAFTIVKTGSIHQAVVGESINQGIKKETGKDVSEHVKQFFDKDIKNQECQNTFDETDCKKTQ